MHYTSASFLAILGVLIGYGSAAPTGGSCSKSFTVNANFDDLSQIPGTSIADIPTPYKGLYYQGFGYATTLPPVLLGTPPHSSPNGGFSAARETAVEGTAMLTTNYPSSNTLTFDLSSFYFSCLVIVPGQALAASPQQCDIAITGYKGPDNSISTASQVCAQQFRYNPTTSTGVQQQAFGQVISRCKGLTHVIFQYTLPGGLQALNGALTLVVDDFKYNYTSKIC